MLWFRPGSDATRGNDPDKAAASTNRDTSPAETKSDAGEGDETLVPLWATDRTPEMQDLADRLEARWHASESAARDPWRRQAAKLRQRLAEMSAEMEPPTPPAASKRGRATTNGNP